MEYKKINNKYILRLDPKEEIVSTIKDLCTKESINCGTITGIGAVNELMIGLFNPSNKEYKSKTLKDNFEIASLTGNISVMNNEVYLHLHICVTDENFNAFGGHLNSAIISATGEITITKIDTTIERKFSEKIGLNLYEFNKEEI